MNDPVLRAIVFLEGLSKRIRKTEMERVQLVKSLTTRITPEGVEVCHGDTVPKLDVVESLDNLCEDLKTYHKEHNT